MDDICREPVSTGNPDAGLVLEKIHVLTLEVGPLLVQVSPLPNVLFRWRWLFGTLFAMQGKRSRLHELEALTAHDPTIEVGMKRQCQCAVLLEAQHRVILEVPAIIFVSSFNVVKGEGPVVL